MSITIGAPATAAKATRSNHITLMYQTPPGHIWESLALQQQQAVFQSIVQVCRQLVRSRNDGEEVSDDQP